MTTATLAQSATHQNEALLFFTLLQLVIIVIMGRVGGELAARISQSRAVGEIVVGILLGPSLFGLLAPDMFQYVFQSSSPQPMFILSQIGLVLLMFQIGLEFDFSHLTAKDNRRAVHAASRRRASCCRSRWASPSAITPRRCCRRRSNQLASGAVRGDRVLDHRLAHSRAHHDGVRHDAHRLGVIAISVAAITDVVGWLLLARRDRGVAVGVFLPAAFAQTLGLLALYIAVCWLVRASGACIRAVRHSVVTEHRLSDNLLGLLHRHAFSCRR